MESEFEKTCKIASAVGALQGFDNVRAKFNAEDPELFTKEAMSKLLSGIGGAAQKAKLWNPGQAAKAPVMSRDGVNIAIPGQAATKGSLTGLGKGVAGTTALGVPVGTGLAGASYGKNKTLDTIGTNFDNMDWMSRLGLIWQMITGNRQGAQDRLMGVGSASEDRLK